MLALLAPWVQTVAVVAHDGAGQGHGHGHDHLDATLHLVEFFLHGHDHEPSTPVHSHEFAVARAPLGVGRQSMMPHLYPAWPSAPAVVSPFELQRSGLRNAHSIFGVGPPHPSSSFSILRV